MSPRIGATETPSTADRDRSSHSRTSLQRPTAPPLRHRASVRHRSIELAIGASGRSDRSILIPRDDIPSRSVGDGTQRGCARARRWSRSCVRIPGEANTRAGRTTTAVGPDGPGVKRAAALFPLAIGVEDCLAATAWIR